MQLRLVGLMLFVTAIFLGLIAAATKTATVEVKRPDWQHTTPVEDRSELEAFPANVDARTTPPLEFISVPIIWPLALAGGAGLLMWFLPAPLTNPPSTARRRRQRPRRRRRR